MGGRGRLGSMRAGVRLVQDVTWVSPTPRGDESIEAPDSWGLAKRLTGARQRPFGPFPVEELSAEEEAAAAAPDTGV